MISLVEKMRESLLEPKGCFMEEKNETEIADLSPQSFLLRK